MSKRRKHPRLKFDIIVKDKKGNRQGKTKNISVDGCFIEREEGFTELLPIGSSIELVLDLPNTGEKIEVIGVVKHYGYHEDGMGIFFDVINRRSARLIKKFIGTFLDDVSGDASSVIKDDYWERLDRLKRKTTI